MPARHKRVWSANVSASTSVASSAAPSRLPSRDPSPIPRHPFRFFDLPPELRLRVYELLLSVSQAVDLDPNNYREIYPRLALFLVSRRMHDEACRVFYGQTVRLFPKDGRFFYTKKPLLARLCPQYRSMITSMELILGRGWSKPPACQNTRSSLGLVDCRNFRRLKIFVECDPSDSIFVGFRGEGATEDTYKWFCVDLLHGILEQVPSLETVEIDGYPSVKKRSPLVMGLRSKIAEYKHLTLTWSALREWESDEGETDLMGLEKAASTLRLADVGRVVEVIA